MTWEFDFDQSELNIPEIFTDDDQFFFGNKMAEQNLTLNQQNNLSEPPKRPVVQRTLTENNIPKSPVQNKGNAIADENDQLRKFFITLKEKSVRVEQINRMLKEQLDECKSWFGSALNYGMKLKK